MRDRGWIRGVLQLIVATLFVAGCVLPGDAVRAGEPELRETDDVTKRLDQQQQLIERLLKLTEQQHHELDQLRRTFVLERTSPNELFDAIPPAPLLGDGFESVAPLSDSPRQLTGGEDPSANPFTADQARELDRRIANHPVKPPVLQNGLRFGYADGFTLTSPEGLKLNTKEAPFVLRVNGRLQMRYTNFDSHGPNRDENNFEFERAFLIFTGTVYTPDLAYHIKLDADSDETEGVDLLDWYTTYDVGHGVFDCAPGAFGIKAGKWKMPFHRARQEASHQFQLVDRAMASEFFDINRSIGVGMFGRFDLGERAINWETAVFNGFQTQRFVPGRAGELDRNFGYATRVYSDLIGEWGKDGEPDLSYHDAPAVRVGAATAFTRINKLDGLREFFVPRVTDSGKTLASLLPVAVSEFDECLYSVDANFKYRGSAVLSEYYFRSITHFAGAPVSDLFDHGFMLQAGHFVWRDKLEVATRWSRIVGNSGTLGAADRSADEITGGGTWYIRGNNVKVVFDATHLNGAPINSTAVNIRPGDAGWLFRTQFQILF